VVSTKGPRSPSETKAIKGEGAQKTEAMRSATAKEVASFWANSVRVLLADMQSRFSMIQVDLDATQNFVIDDKLIAQLNDRPAFHIERFLL
jgi:hypothetical protein